MIERDMTVRQAKITQYSGIGTTNVPIIIGAPMHLYVFAGHIVGNVTTSPVRELQQRKLYSGTVAYEVKTDNSLYLLV